MRKGSVISRIHIFFNWVAEESDLPLEEMTEDELFDIFLEFNEDLQGDGQAKLLFKQILDL